MRRNLAALVFAILGLVVGAALAAVGRRGYRRGTFPHCRRCDFNLNALPAQTLRCPECGADLRHPDAIRMGARRRIPLLTFAGTLLAVLCFMAVGFELLAIWGKVDGTRWETVRQLTRDLQQPNHSGRAADELLRRARAGSLDSGDAALAADAIDKLQADPATAWNRTWGDIVQQFQRQRLLPVEKWRHYLEQALTLSARARSHVRAGDPVPLELSVELRAGSDYMVIAPAQLVPVVTCELAGRQQQSTLPAGKLDTIPVPVKWAAMAPSSSAAGKQTLSLDVSVRIQDAQDTLAVVRRHFTLPVEFTKEPSVTLASPAALEKDVADAIRLRGGAAVENVSAGPAPLVMQADAEGMKLGRVWIVGPPMAVSFRVILRQEGNEWPVGSALVAADDFASVPLSLRSQAAGTVPHAGAAELVMLPDPEPAAGTLGIDAIWGAMVRREVVLVQP